MVGVEKDAALIAALVDYAGVSLTEVAKRAKVDPETLRKPVKGIVDTRLSQRTLEKLMAAFPEFPGWIEYLRPIAGTLGHKLGRDGRFLDPEPVSDNLAIPMLELAYGMGGSLLEVYDVGERIEYFPRAFVRMFTYSPADQLVFSHGIGDSMEPTIGDRDLLLIDRSRNSIRMNDQIWVLASGGIGMVKRVRVDGGQTRLLSDNRRVPDYVAAEDELQIIGRVIAVVRKL
jgi:hypothetical protein